MEPGGASLRKETDRGAASGAGEISSAGGEPLPQAGAKSFRDSGHPVCDRREAVLEELADVRLALKRFEKYPASGAADPASETVDLPVPRGEEDL